MKALTQQELQQFVHYFAPILDGAQLQDVLVNDRGLALGFRKDVHFWMILDLVPNAPMLLLFEEECPFKKGPKTKPVSLFLNSHAKNLYLTKMTVQEEYGRVVKLELRNSSSDCELEVRLIPKQCNLIVKAQGKQIAWEKPLALTPPPKVEQPPVPRSIEEIHEEWLQEQGSQKKSSLDPVAQWEKQKEKDLAKKRKALSEIQKQIESDKEDLWYEAGLYLKTHGTLQVPDHLKSCINEKESLSWNIEQCFAKAKQLAGKKDGARERFDELVVEIAQLEKSRYQDKVKKPALVDLMQKAEARGRKLHLENGALAYCGKSAADNLALLRQAKAWDYWMHLRDYPGAHAIIHRQRDQLISEKEIQEVAEWVAKESLSAKTLMVGQKVAVVIVECRFVRPIKGDKLGRVTYHSERTLSFTLRHT
ncbi:MAG: fibronectin-binding protein [Bdellovibrio sp. ArHS]|uniref:DUF814 domain-containing protein n=1 Tax=Bdellovibrio sp. ArHS TaxID=1569284 RepID=UPI000583664F|nr:DUF814 domain-containing protein [Bdellovibrio sp. ArHS]KHD87461.1 MAG: fibronectin-binding protein [Bdellovibrio sp. ArHS]